MGVHLQRAQIYRDMSFRKHAGAQKTSSPFKLGVKNFFKNEVQLGMVLKKVQNKEIERMKTQEDYPAAEKSFMVKKDWKISLLLLPDLIFVTEVE